MIIYFEIAAAGKEMSDHDPYGLNNKQRNV